MDQKFRNVIRPGLRKRPSKRTADLYDVQAAPDSCPITSTLSKVLISTLPVSTFNNSGFWSVKSKRFSFLSFGYSIKYSIHFQLYTFICPHCAFMRSSWWKLALIILFLTPKINTDRKDFFFLLCLIWMCLNRKWITLKPPNFPRLLLLFTITMRITFYLFLDLNTSNFGSSTFSN